MPLKFRELIKILQNYNGEEACKYIEDLGEQKKIEPLETFVRIVKFS